MSRATEPLSIRSTASVSVGCHVYRARTRQLRSAIWTAAPNSEQFPNTALVPLVWQNKRVLFKLLFDASAETLLAVSADPKHLGAKIGFLSVLHTPIMRKYL